MSRFPPEKDPGVGRILVVDDDDAGRYAKSRVLRQAGYSVAEARTGRDALRQLQEEVPDLVLLDVQLPDIGGLEVCRRIKANPETSPVPVLQTSATYRDDESKIAGFECGADGYVSEPLDPSLLIATVRALLRMRSAERAVGERALEWQATFDAIGDGVALADSTGRIIRSNRALAALLGRDGDLAGARIEELLPLESGSEIWRNLERGQRQHAEVEASNRVLSLKVDPVRDGYGRIRGAVCIVSDITERKAMNERLWHKQKLESIGLLAGGVAHDFNNILMGILGNASLGLERSDDPRLAEGAFRDILSAGERAADLTRQLLAYAGKGKAVVQPVDLSEVAGGVLPLVKPSIPGKIELLLDLESGLPAVNADKTQIEQILMNLLINAAEAIGANAGRITVRTARVNLPGDCRKKYFSESEVRGHYVSLEVADNGAGMDEETASHIFDPFFTTKFLGRGLGLSAVLGIVRAHKGAIRVVSEPGRGARFELLFPAVAMPAKAPDLPAREAVAECSPRGGTILAIDDEPVVRNFFRMALERHGYEVVLAENGVEGLRIFAEQPGRFDLVLLDLVMPVMGGKEILPRLFELRPDVQVIVTSGQMEETVRRDLSEWDIAGFIQKPCTSLALLEKIRRAAPANPGDRTVESGAGREGLPHVPR